MKHKTSFCFSKLGSTGGRVLLDDDGLAAGAHVAVDLVADLDPKLSLIPEIRQLTMTMISESLNTHCLAVAMAAASSPIQSWPGLGEVRQTTMSFLFLMCITTNWSSRLPQLRPVTSAKLSPLITFARAPPIASSAKYILGPGRRSCRELELVCNGRAARTDNNI